MKSTLLGQRLLLMHEKHTPFLFLLSSVFMHEKFTRAFCSSYTLYTPLPYMLVSRLLFLERMLVPANLWLVPSKIVRIKPLVAVTQLPQNANRKQWLDKNKMEARKENRIILLISQSVLSCPSSSTGYVEGPYSIALLGDFCTTFLASSFFLLLSYVILCT